MELDNILKDVKKKFITLPRNEEKEDIKIVLGLSGGADSILLYYVLKKLSYELHLEIIPIYINHLIRSSANEESWELSSYLKKNFNDKLYVFSVDVPKLAKIKKKSLEEMGRYIRYLILNHVLKIKDADYIALGHNLDDNVETFIFRICRGTGIEGLKSMIFHEGKLIRPLIEFRKAEILKIVKKIGLFYIDDLSNYDLDFTRNRIRHKILKELLKINEKAFEHIANFSKDARELTCYIQKQINELIAESILYKDENIIIAKIPKIEESYIFKEYLKALFRIYKGDSQKIKREQIEKFDKLCKQKASFSLNFPEDIVFEKGFEYILIRKKDFISFFKSQKIKDEYTLISKEIGVLKIDKKPLEKLTLRSFQDGDIYRGRKLKEIFLERRIPRFVRALIPLVASGKNILYSPFFDSPSFTLYIENREYKINFEEGTLYSKIKQIFKPQESV